eukprot:CAMPEP_0183336406 /NCGR_PEP_ID=MMETSP0164_2-20130417/4390_1 /TAXON_ID=221442 /ORGANISM="Coccolithus pelagicus ssp braarudi, Strain PLY182g" /LENGTH=117 /DNA_ID=CAMNT_0025505913 /DNA_START=279 /DNA_END=633 /DNA_ORIENTATION=+
MGALLILATYAATSSEAESGHRGTRRRQVAQAEADAPPPHEPGAAASSHALGAPGVCAMSSRAESATRDRLREGQVRRVEQVREREAGRKALLLLHPSVHLRGPLQLERAIDVKLCG